MRSVGRLYKRLRPGWCPGAPSTGIGSDGCAGHRELVAGHAEKTLPMSR